MITEAELLQAALRGYQAERDRLDQVIADIQARIGNPRGGGAPAPVRRTMSAAARQRIAAAQRKRWAKFHKR